MFRRLTPTNASGGFRSIEFANRVNIDTINKYTIPTHMCLTYTLYRRKVEYDITIFALRFGFCFFSFFFLLKLSAESSLLCCVIFIYIFALYEVYNEETVRLYNLIRLENSQSSMDFGFLKMGELPRLLGILFFLPLGDHVQYFDYKRGAETMLPTNATI